MMIGVDCHPSDHYIAFVDTEAGESGERRLNLFHSEIILQGAALGDLYHRDRRHDLSCADSCIVLAVAWHCPICQSGEETRMQKCLGSRIFRAVLVLAIWVGAVAAALFV